MLPLRDFEPGAAVDVLEDCSVEVTARDLPGIPALASRVRPRSDVAITSLPGEDPGRRLDVARAIRLAGLTPVPHIAARSLASPEALSSSLTRFREVASVDRVFVIAGDGREPRGPFSDAFAVIGGGALTVHGIRRVGVAGYPQGHPLIPGAALWTSLAQKARAIEEQGLEMEIVTQFGFDHGPVLEWLGRLRQSGIGAPVRVGVAGPTSAKALMAFAARCGVGASARVLRKYGVSLTSLFSVTGPDRFVDGLLGGLDPRVHGVVRLHVYPFGGLADAGEWIASRRGVASDAR